MDFPYEGIPTIPPRKNMTHMVRLPLPDPRSRRPPLPTTPPSNRTRRDAPSLTLPLSPFSGLLLQRLPLPRRGLPRLDGQAGRRGPLEGRHRARQQPPRKHPRHEETGGHRAHLCRSSDAARQGA